MSVGSTPWGGTVTLTTADTVYNLVDLIEALDVSLQPDLTGTPRAQWVTFQADLDGGGTRYYVGINSSLSAANCLKALFATQSFTLPADANLILLGNIYLMADANAAVMHIGFLTR